MPVICTNKRLPHFVEALGNRLCKFRVDQLEHPIDSVGHIGFRNFINLFKRPLLKLDDELLVHCENGDFKIRMG